MGIMIEMGHEAWVRHPEGKIVLMDGRELECYAVENDEATTADGAMVEAMAPIEGAMGFKRLLSLFRSKNEELSYERLQEDLFVDNAFYLWGHKDKILGDSRMFLCAVRMSNNLAYTGTIGLRDATLGVYVEWWMTCAGATMTDGKGRRSSMRRSGASVRHTSCKMCWTSCVRWMSSNRITRVSALPKPEI